MKEVHNLRRGWSGGGASLSSPARRTSALFGRTLSVSNHLPSLGRLPLRVVRSLVVFLVATPRWPPVRCAAGLVFLVGRRGPGRPPPWCPHGGLLPAGTCWTLWQIGGDSNAIAAPQAAGAVFLASAHLSRVLVGAGVTPAAHSHGPAPLAPLVTAARSCAHGRVNSARAVDRPCSRLIRPQVPHPRTAARCLSSQVSRRRVLLVALSLLDSKRYGRSAPAP